VSGGIARICPFQHIPVFPDVWDALHDAIGFVDQSITTGSQNIRFAFASDAPLADLLVQYDVASSLIVVVRVVGALHWLLGHCSPGAAAGQEQHGADSTGLT
jgi:hypothetical protein